MKHEINGFEFRISGTGTRKQNEVTPGEDVKLNVADYFDADVEGEVYMKCEHQSIEFTPEELIQLMTIGGDTATKALQMVLEIGKFSMNHNKEQLKQRVRLQKQEKYKYNPDNK